MSNEKAAKHCGKPPSYQHSTNLPSYEDVEKIKEDELRQQYLEIFFGTDVCNNICYYLYKTIWIFKILIYG